MNKRSGPEAVLFCLEMVHLFSLSGGPTVLHDKAPCSKNQDLCMPLWKGGPCKASFKTPLLRCLSLVNQDRPQDRKPAWEDDIRAMRVILIDFPVTAQQNHPIPNHAPPHHDTPP